MTPAPEFPLGNPPVENFGAAKMILNECGLLEFVLMPSRLTFKVDGKAPAPVLRRFWVSHEFDSAMMLRLDSWPEYERVLRLLRVCWACALLGLVGVSYVGLSRIYTPEFTAEYPQAFTFALLLSLLCVGAMQLFSHDLYGAIQRLAKKFNTSTPAAKHIG